MAAITINGITIDPAAQAPALAAADLETVDAETSDYILIQATRPMTAADRAAIQALGATILEYVPDDTYICCYPPSDLGPIRALAFVSWANVYLRPFKISPRLRQPAPPTTLAFVPVTTSLSKAPETVDVVLQKGAMSDAVKAEVAKAAGVDAEILQVGSDKIRLTVPQNRLDALAAIDAVRHIEPYVAPHLSNNVARDILEADQAQAAGSLRGEGQVICVCDTGFDSGTAQHCHPAFAGRVGRLYPLGRAVASDPDGHGTHVCGSVLGDGQALDGTVIRGTAPAATLIMQSVLDAQGGLGGLPADLHGLFDVPYSQDGARVHTNSWGSAVKGAYTSNASEVDDFVWQHRDMVILFAAGNEGSDAAGTGVVAAGSIGSPGTAKNCITVGASENNRPGFTPQGYGQVLTYGAGWPSDFPAKPIHSDPVADKPEGMAAFSSRGPTQNGRIRPDLVAPGTSILSTKSSVTATNGWGPYDSLFFFDGGTSMATPLVAGCAAVVRQHLIADGHAQPSAALIKAMLINGAKPMLGQYPQPEVKGVPDNSQGFGRVDLAASVGPYPAGTTLAYHDEQRALDTGDIDTFQQQVIEGGTIKVTLVWTDPPGEALQNDLDLIVTTPAGMVVHGNMIAGAPQFDRVNNVEQVEIKALSAGQLEIKVEAYRTVSPQSYALVIRTA